MNKYLFLDFDGVLGLDYKKIKLINELSKVLLEKYNLSLNVIFTTSHQEWFDFKDLYQILEKKLDTHCYINFFGGICYDKDNNQKLKFHSSNVVNKEDFHKISNRYELIVDYCKTHNIHFEDIAILDDVANLFYELCLFHEFTKPFSEKIEAEKLLCLLNDCETLEEFLGNLLRNTIYLDLQQNTSQYYKYSSSDEKWLLKKKPEFLSNEEKQYLQYLDLKDIEFIKQSYYFSSNEYDYLRKKYKDYSIEEMEIVLEEVYSIYKVFVLVVSKTTNTKINDTQIEELEVNAIKQILTKVLPISSLY